MFASVIIPNWNGAALLRACLLSLQVQTASDFEIIVVDNGSTDGSLTMLANEFPDVRLLALPTNCGLAVACNAGVRIARGRTLVMLNNDIEAEPDWLQALVGTLERHPSAGSAASKMLLWERRTVLHSAGDLYRRDGIPENRGVWQEDHGQYDGSPAVFGGCGGAVAYRRELWEALGGFDEALFMYCEDVDLAWRAQLTGWACVFVPQARVYHHLSATGGGVTASFYTGRNTLWVLFQDVPGPLLRRYAGPILRAQLGIAWQAARAWRGAAARARLCGQLAALWGLPGILRRRRIVQAQRTVSIDDLEACLSDAPVLPDS